MATDKQPVDPWDYFVERNKRLPTAVEFDRMTQPHSDCHHPDESRQDGYGLAGGGMGVYEYCNRCNRILWKEEEMPDG